MNFTEEYSENTTKQVLVDFGNENETNLEETFTTAQGDISEMTTAYFSADGSGDFDSK